MHDNDAHPEISEDAKQQARVVCFMREAVNHTAGVNLTSMEIASLSVQFKLAMHTDHCTLVFEPDLTDVAK